MSNHDEGEQAPELIERSDEESSEESSETSTESSSDDDNQPIVTFETDELAQGARETALKKYNAHDYEAALELQHSILFHFTKKYGEIDGRCALYYLDYGTTCLSIIQEAPNEDAVLAGNNGSRAEEFESCRNALECARVCFEKLDDDEESTDTPQKKKDLVLRMAETHNALAELALERDDEEEAIKELEVALALQRDVLEPKNRAILWTVYNLGKACLRSENFGEAEEHFEEALKIAVEAQIEDDLVEEIRRCLDEAVELKKGGLDRVREEIRELFPDEASHVRDPAEEIVDNKIPDLDSQRPTGAAGIPLLSSKLPDEITSSNASRGKLTGHLSSRDPNSSVSFFPKQFSRGPAQTEAEDNGDCPAISTLVNRVVAIKKKSRREPSKDDDSRKKITRAEGTSSE